jgi:hypothetical protein
MSGSFEIAIEGTGRSSARAREGLQLSDALLGEGQDRWITAVRLHKIILLGSRTSVGDQGHRCWTQILAGCGKTELQRVFLPVSHGC